MKYILAIFFLLLPATSFAEYRAYRLKITNSATGQERLVLSTVDHYQYPDYFPDQTFENVSYVESWMCWGNTGDYKRICPQPSPSTRTP